MVARNSDVPTYQSEHMRSKIYDLNGKMVYLLISKDVKHYAHSGNTFFSLPEMTLFDSNDNPSWFIQSNKAELTADKMLYLNGNINANSLTDDSRLQSIITEQVEINLVNKDIISNDQVTLHGINFTSIGNKLRGNLTSKTAKLFQNVKTYYGANHDKEIMQ